MKTVLKILIIFLLITVSIVSLILFGLNNQGILDKIAKTAINQSGFNVKYSSIKGGLFDGLEIKNFNYENSVKADLKLKVDFKKLSDGVLHIKEVNLSNLWIDEQFLKNLTKDSNKTQEPKSDKSLFIKKVIADSVTLNLVDFHYEPYVIEYLNLQIDDLTYDMKDDISAKIAVDLNSNVANALLKAKIEKKKYTLNLDGDIKREFLTPFVSEHNITIKNAPYVRVNVEGDFEDLKANMRVSGIKLNYQDIEVFSQDLNLTALFGIKKGNLDAKILADIDSTATSFFLQSDAKLNINDINNTLNFNLSSSLNPKIKYLDKYIQEQNITIKKLSKLQLFARGDFKNIKANIRIDDAKLRLNDISISSKGVDVDAEYSVLGGDVDAKVFSKIVSDVANFNLDGKLSLNTNDINNTLKVDMVSHIIPIKESFKTKLADQNISIKKMPNFVVTLVGDYKNIDFLAHLGEGDITYNSYKITPKVFDIDASYSLKDGKLDADIITDLKSSIADVDLKANIVLDSDDINNTLVYRSDLKILAKSVELKEYKIEIKKPTLVGLNINGDAKNTKAIIDAKGEIIYDKIKIKPYIYDTHASFNLRTKVLNAQFFADITSDIGKIKSDGKVSLNLDDLNNTLKYDTNLLIEDTKPYNGVDLSSLGDIKMVAKGSLKNLRAKIKSPKFIAIANSDDFDKFDINLDTKKILIGEIYRYLPKELQKSFVNLKSDGFYKISANEAKFTSTLRGLKYAKNIIYTDEFDFYLKGKDIKIPNLTLQAKGFKMNIQADKAGDEIKTKIQNRAINAQADIKLEPFYVDGYVKIDSIDQLIKEINKVYPLEIGIKIDGRLDLVANMEGRDAKVRVNSKKIEFEDGNLIDLDILGYYSRDSILVKNFDFELKDFKPKEFNRVVKLKKDGFIGLSEANSTIDIELKDLIAFKGSQKGDVTIGVLSTKNLVLAYNGYGYTKLTSKLEMFQSTDKLAVTGFIEFADTEITYESPFLDVSKDPDIIVITRESKHKKEPSDTFLLNTFLDLDIRSKNEMIYKVDAGEIEFAPDINVRKDLGFEPKITGKIKVLDGQYDMADKRFQIEEGAIAFRGQEGSNPLLDLHVNYEEIEDVVIMIAIGGDKNRPKLIFSSKPMLSKKDIFSYLLFGMSASETEGAATSANKAAEKIFGRAIAKDLARELNLDRLDMNRNAFGGIDIKAGKKINRKSILYYQNRSNKSSLLYERKLSDKWSVDTEVGKQSQGVDIYYRRGYK